MLRFLADNQKPNLYCPKKDTVVKYTSNHQTRIFFVVNGNDPGSGLFEGHPKPIDTNKGSGAVFPVGLHEVSYRAKDRAGNEDKCTFSVKVIKRGM